jgi:hypothetical protein
MTCYYYVKLPTGEELRVLASFSPVTSTEEIAVLQTLISNYKKDLSKAYTKLSSYIMNNTPLTYSEFKSWLKTIQKTKDNVTDEELGILLESLNKKIERHNDTAGSIDLQALIELLANNVLNKRKLEIQKENGD